MAESAGRAGFPRAVRLLSPADFARVFAVRRSAAGGPLVVYSCPAAGATQPARLGVSVSRRIGNAVARNRWKRRLREAFRRIRETLPTGNDFVVVVRSGVAPSGMGGARQIEELIAQLATRIVARPGYRENLDSTRAPAAGRPPQRRR